MLNKQRVRVWVTLMIISGMSSAPLEDQRIYFPGEDPSGELGPRNYGQPANIQTEQAHEYTQNRPSEAGYSTSHQFVGHSSNIGAETPQQIGYTGHLMQPLPEEFVNGQYPSTDEIFRGEVGQHNLPVNQPAYEGDGQLSRYHNQYRKAGQHKNSQWESTSDERQNLQSGILGEPAIHQLKETHSFMHNNPLNQDIQSDLSKDGTIHGGHKMTKHTWTSRYSTSGNGRIEEDQGQSFVSGINHQGGSVLSQESAKLGYGLNSNSEGIRTPPDLTTILDGSPHRHHEINPIIKQAMDNVARDFEGTSASTLKQPAHHTIHKISHIKKTRVQNIGREPTHIQSTVSNDNINLADLITQLQMLEESPRHTNITWCEEKIKEFLRALRRKQDSGIYINEQVQEQTLHQVLTHESSEETSNDNGVHEPPMIKATVRPLGGGDLSKSEEKLEWTSGINHEVNNPVNVIEVKNHTLEELSSEVHKENNPEWEQIITVIPHTPSKQLEIMSHQHESPIIPPPFTSDSNNEQGDLELELPEYQPIQNNPSKEMHSEDVEAIENNVQKETMPLQPYPSVGEEDTHFNHEEQHQSNFGKHGQVTSLEEQVPPQSEGSKYQGTYETVQQESSDNVLGNHHTNHNQDNHMPYEQQQNIMESTQQEHHQASFTPEVQDELDLQLPEYPIPADSPASSQHASQEQTKTQQLEHQYEIKSQDNNGKNPSHSDNLQNGHEMNHEYIETEEETHHIVHGRPYAPQRGTESVKGSYNGGTINTEDMMNLPVSQEGSAEITVSGNHKEAVNESRDNLKTQEEDQRHAEKSTTTSIQDLHQQQVNYDTLIEELIQLESLPGHQAIDKCEEKIQEFLEILKYQQEQGFGRNQLELQRLHETLIEQAKARSQELTAGSEEGSTLPPTSFWRKVQKKIKKTYEDAKDRAKQVIG